jgi:outer membrane protein assembly factor BamA
LIIPTYFRNRLIIISTGIFLFLFLLFLSTLPAEPLKIKSIEITGNKHFSQAQIRKALKTNEGDTFSYKELNNNLKNVLQLYSKHGFYLTKILPPQVIPDQSGKYVNIKIQILENKKLKVAGLNFSGNRYFSDKKLKAMISTKLNQPFSIEKINADLQTIVNAYGEKGYPFCQAILDSFRIDKDKMFIYWQIRENDFVRISKLVCRGNEVTKDKTLKLITNFEDNEIYQNTKVEMAKRRLIRKKYIADAEIIPLNKRELLIQIKEKRMNHFQGVLGFSSSKEESSFADKLSGYIDFSFLNILGTDRDIALSWKRLKKNSSQFYLAYKEPFILNQQISSELSFKRRSIDTTYVNSDFKLKTFFQTNNFDKIGITLLTKSTLIDTVRTRKKGVGADWERDKLDYAENPRSGYHSHFSYLINWKSKQCYQQEVEADIQYAIPIFRNNVFSLRGRTNLLYSFEDSISTYDLYNFGGYDNLRGFIDNQFSSDKFCLFNAEYRYLLSRESRVFVFWDYAYCSEYNSLMGCGFGIRLQSKIGILKIDYGIGYQERKLTNPLEGTLHFGIETGI